MATQENGEEAVPAVPVKLEMRKEVKFSLTDKELSDMVEFIGGQKLQRSADGSKYVAETRGRGFWVDAF